MMSSLPEPFNLGFLSIAPTLRRVRNSRPVLCRHRYYNTKPTMTTDAIGYNGGFFLGFDLSTQSLTATAVDEGGSQVFTKSVNFESDLVHHVQPVQRNPPHATMRSRLFNEAFDVILNKMKSESFPFGSVKAISGAAQQHGSVFLTADFEKYLRNLDPSKTIYDQIPDSAYSFLDGPIWEDSSTQEECDFIENKLGGGLSMASKVGARATLRFTGPQILARSRRDSAAFQRVSRVSLISAYLTSLLSGQLAVEDVSDACGTHLFDLISDPPRWLSSAVELVNATGKLSENPVHSYTIVGNVSRYLRERYQFAHGSKIIVGVGDNPASIAALPQFRRGDVLVSLGTSDTAQWLVNANELSTTSRGATLAMNFRSPLTIAPSFVRMLVYANGSLTREAVRDKIFGIDTNIEEEESKSWEEFERLVASVPPGCTPAKVGCFYYRPEIAPRMKAEPHARIVHAKSGDITTATASHAELCRLVLEWRALVFRAHMRELSMNKVSRLIVTGGAARSKVIPQVLADIIDAPVYRLQNTASAALGAARRARVGFLMDIGVVDAQLAPDNEADSMLLVAKPDSKRVEMYRKVHIPAHQRAFEML